MKHNYIFNIFIFLQKLFILCIPGNIEKIMHICQANGNMGLYGLWWDIYNKRNFLYLSLGIFLLFYWWNYWYSGLVIILFGLLLFIKTLMNWYIFIQI